MTLTPTIRPEQIDEAAVPLLLDEEPPDNWSAKPWSGKRDRHAREAAELLGSDGEADWLA